MTTMMPAITKKHDGNDIDDAPAGLAAKDAEHQQRHGADAEHEFRQERNERGKLRGVHLLTLASVSERRGLAAVCTALSAC